MSDADGQGRVKPLGRAVSQSHEPQPDPLRVASLGRAVVITVSDRVSAGTAVDRSGPLAASGLIALGFEVDPVVVVPDGEPVADALRRALGDGIDVVLTTGGTGIGPRDRTPEATRGLLDLEIPALAAAIVQAGVANGVPTAVLSRALAGVAGRTIVVNLPGSSGGVRDALGVLSGVLPHAVAQLRGADHG